MNEPRNYYQDLELTSSADESTIRKAFQRLALRFHPDKNRRENTSDNRNDKKSEEYWTNRFQTINEAYMVLSDHKKREKYDEQMRKLAPAHHKLFNRSTGSKAHANGSTSRKGPRSSPTYKAHSARYTRAFSNGDPSSPSCSTPGSAKAQRPGAPFPHVSPEENKERSRFPHGRTNLRPSFSSTNPGQRWTSPPRNSAFSWRETHSTRQSTGKTSILFSGRCSRGGEHLQSSPANNGHGKTESGLRHTGSRFRPAQPNGDEPMARSIGGYGTPRRKTVTSESEKQTASTENVFTDQQPGPGHNLTGFQVSFGDSMAFWLSIDWSWALWDGPRMNWASKTSVKPQTRNMFQKKNPGYSAETSAVQGSYWKPGRKTHVSKGHSSSPQYSTTQSGLRTRKGRLKRDC